MSGTRWVKTTSLDENTVHTAQLSVPQTDTITVDRNTLERFLLEAGYEPQEAPPGP